MGYSFIIDDDIRVRENGKYPWPCDSDKDRPIELFTDDVLTKSEDGTYMKHNGLGCFGIVLTDQQVESIGEPTHFWLI